MAGRRRVFAYLNALGLLSGSEGGADWANDLLDRQDGCLVLSHIGVQPNKGAGTAEVDLPEEFIENPFDLSIRVPLRELVYHDSTFVTWRWNHSPNVWSEDADQEHPWWSIRPEVLWNKWDLLHILYGQMPLFVVDPDWMTSDPDGRK